MIAASTIDLMVLGLLMEAPLNAYELARSIENRQLGKLLQVSKPAVYKSCKRLFTAGLLTGKIVRDGEAPEKVIYTVNKKGENHFLKLMEHYSQEIQPIYFNFNSFLWHIDKLDQAEAMNMLRDLQTSLKSVHSWTQTHAKEKENDADIPFSGRMIIKQYQMVTGTLVAWIAETIKEYNKRGR